MAAGPDLAFTATIGPTIAHASPKEGSIRLESLRAVRVGTYRTGVRSASPAPTGTGSTGSDVAFKFVPERRACDGAEFVLPSRTMVEAVVECAQMRQFVHERLEAVMLGVAAHQDGFAMSEDDAAYATPMRALNHGLAH